MNNNNSLDYFDHFDKCIRLTDFESIFLKRLSDNTVEISYFDSLIGTMTKLASYKSGRWNGYNPPNFEKMFMLFKKHKNAKPALIRFLTPNDYPYEINKMEKVIVCFKKRFHITIRKTKKNLHIESLDFFEMIHKKN